MGGGNQPKGLPKTLLWSLLMGKPVILRILHSLNGSNSEETLAGGPRTKSVVGSFPVFIFQECQRSCAEISFNQSKPRKPEFWEETWLLTKNLSSTFTLQMSASDVCTTAQMESVCYFLQLICFKISKIKVADK